MIGATELVLLIQVASAAVVGTVRDRHTGEPLAGALVTLSDIDRTALTDEFGRYSFEGVLPGPQHLSVQLLSYETRTLHALVAAHGQLEINLSLRPKPIPLGPVSVAPTVPRSRGRGPQRCELPGQERQHRRSPESPAPVGIRRLRGVGGRIRYAPTRDSQRHPHPWRRLGPDLLLPRRDPRLQPVPRGRHVQRVKPGRTLEPAGLVVLGHSGVLVRIGWGHDADARHESPGPGEFEHDTSTDDGGRAPWIRWGRLPIEPTLRLRRGRDFSPRGRTPARRDR